MNVIIKQQDAIQKLSALTLLDLTSANAMLGIQEMEEVVMVHPLYCSVFYGNNSALCYGNYLSCDQKDFVCKHFILTLIFF